VAPSDRPRDRCVAGRSRYAPFREDTRAAAPRAAGSAGLPRRSVDVLEQGRIRADDRSDPAPDLRRPRDAHRCRVEAARRSGGHHPAAGSTTATRSRIRPGPSRTASSTWRAPRSTSCLAEDGSPRTYAGRSSAAPKNSRCIGRPARTRRRCSRGSRGRAAPVVRGGALFRVWGSTSLEPTSMRAVVAIEAERTPDQDPAFAFRQLVDIAERALSPGINDPTTACRPSTASMICCPCWPRAVFHRGRAWTTRVGSGSSFRAPTGMRWFTSRSTRSGNTVGDRSK